jgi:hypothetical protein
VFDRCVTSNNQHEPDNHEIDFEAGDMRKAAQSKAKKANIDVSPDDPRFAITFNYELLDDAYFLPSVNAGDSSTAIRMSGEAEANDLWDENHKLVPEAKTYSNSADVLKNNHPLMIMVHEKRAVSIHSHMYFVVLNLDFVLFHQVFRTSSYTEIMQNSANNFEL